MTDQATASTAVSITVTVNGQKYSGEVEPRTILVHFRRDTLGLTGTHVGCDTSQCGACTVLMDGLAVKSCTVFTVQADGAHLVTIEGLAPPDSERATGEVRLHPVQEGFWEKHGLQCGYCTPGMIMSAIDIVSRKGSALDEQTVRAELEGNLCRCTGYHNIVKAVVAGAQAMAQAPLSQAAE